ncbi:DNA alkylation repair protein [Agitococcus lubricus]|uniref:3-methyladenine DNA glycosylase AlkC n=1 Tax=Agitococcus lubricus TaxID=1077255 RepID=A0A2T5J2W6_9GAMM|nr:DNA alkylation repair protein [Agitococcus lubricus]PTQ90950.1 3-methyladenine DNA glycosylase AlkC [Agitococcus lubricus]
MAELLKYRLDHAAIVQIADTLSQILPHFAHQVFITQAVCGLEPLALKERVIHLIGILAHHLPTDFVKTAAILQQVPNHWPTTQVQGDYGFAAWPLIDYVSHYGLAHPQVALATLKRLTPLFTAEFAIRPFLQHHFELSYAHIQQWVNDPHPHVRRLASEGLRPRLPWGQQVSHLLSEPERIIAVLTHLKDDDSEYVRRSVANNLNDISKMYPDVVVQLCQTWWQDAPEARQRLIKHASRGLVKAGYPAMLAVLGYQQVLACQDICFQLNQHQVTLGQTLNFTLRFTMTRAQPLVIDYVLQLPRANNRLGQKVFKWKTALFGVGEHNLSQDYVFKPLTTRRYYAGEHRFCVMVNGQMVAQQTVYLTI